MKNTCPAELFWREKLARHVQQQQAANIPEGCNELPFIR